MSALALRAGPAHALAAGMAIGAALLVLGSAAHLTCSVFCLHRMPSEICASAR